MKNMLRGLSITAAAGVIALFAMVASAQESSALPDADNGFGLDLLRQVASGQPGQNIFISPFSAATALQMVANGAAGQTKTEMQRVLHTAGIAPPELNADCKALNQSLNSQKDVILDLANGIWHQDNFQLTPAFISDNRKYFDAELAAVNFLSPASAKTINDWADKQTRGKIQGVVSYPFPPATEVVLANAIYFKGKWEEQFEKNLTLPRNFHFPDGSVRQVPMMSKRHRFSYEEGEGYQAVELPYVGDRLEMILFLPATGSSPQQLLEKFKGETWRDKILPGFSLYEGFLAFPKFRLDYDVTLNDPLKALGMPQAFSDQADFSAMANRPVCISEVQQKSYVDVDEEGTEAAAVTTVTVTALAMPMRPARNFTMIVDRPFFFVISDRRTRTILFMGIVNDPKTP
ncbi:MAG TPA: serpin family protein [Verrucomicrobiae bacterium]|nr:serpin family protein [Verrucomicrobiae bacterium]